MPVPDEINQQLKGQWQAPMTGVCCKNPGVFCFSLFCGCCKAYSQRGEILEITREPYVCCGGLLPCCTGECDRCWLVWESLFCFSWAVTGNRYIIQTRFGIRNSSCDDFLITLTCVMNMIILYLRLFMDVPRELKNLVHIITALVMSCMLTQQHIELENIMKCGVVYSGMPSNLIVLLPKGAQKTVVTLPPGASYGIVPPSGMPYGGQPGMYAPPPQVMMGQVAYGQPQQMAYGAQPVAYAQPVYAQPVVPMAPQPMGYPQPYGQPGFPQPVAYGQPMPPQPGMPGRMPTPPGYPHGGPQPGAPGGPYYQ